MGKLKTAYMKATMDDMGDAVSVEKDETVEEAQRAYELSKYSTEELEAEFDGRGWKVVSK